MSSIVNSGNHFDREIEKLLKNVAEGEGLCNYKIEKAPGALKGDGYLGVITGVQITGTDECKKKNELNLVVKSASKSNVLRDETPIADVFEREIYMYNTVIPVFQKFQTEKGLQPFCSSAKCYKACTIDRNEALVLENLKYKGYNVWERRIPMEHDHVKMVMTEYGRFHALSFALRDQNPERYEKMIGSMYDIFDRFLNEKADFSKMFANQCMKAQKSLNPATDKDALNKYIKFLGEIAPFLKSLPKLVDDYSVILHGDCWTNNMMFNYEDASNPKKPTKMALIDLQLSRIGPPVLDLSYFFYSCSSKKVIANLEYYLNVYYDSFYEYLKQLGSNPDEVYPYDVFRQHWKKCAKFGLICSMLLIFVMLSEQDEVVDFTEITEAGRSVIEAFDYELSNLEEYHDRVRHIILHFVKNNFI